MSKFVPNPNEVPSKSYPNPAWGEVIDELLIEIVEYNKPGYVHLREGTPHPNTRDYPNHKLLKEEYTGEYGKNRRYWCNGYRVEDQYNYDISYSGESNSHPIFTRQYQVRRDQYEPLSKLTNFTGLYGIKVTDGGTGYDPLLPPTVTITGDGSNAEAVAIVSEDGVIQWVYLTNEGSGYSTATISFSSGAATAEAILQLNTNVVGAITITNAGAGYVTAPEITFSSGSAAAIAQISGGAVKAIGITAYGSGYTVAPTISFSSGSAAATATLEEVELKLVKEDVQQFPADDPRRSLYVRVIRQWEAVKGPVLTEQRWEPFINNYVSIRKRIVTNDQVPPDMYYQGTTPGSLTEYQPITFHRYVEVTSAINRLIAWEFGGEDQEYRGTVNYSFPNEVPDPPVITTYYAYAGDNFAVDFGWKLGVKAGFSGPCPARFVRRFTFEPEDASFIAALPEITYIQPEAYVINDGFTYSGGNLIARATQFTIPTSLHPELEVDTIVEGVGPVVPVPGPTAVVPATIPTTIAEGEEILASIKVTQWNFGLFIYDFVYVTKPIPPP